MRCWLRAVVGCAALALLGSSAGAEAGWEEPFVVDRTLPAAGVFNAPEVAVGRSGATAVWVVGETQLTSTGAKQTVPVAKAASGPAGAPFGPAVKLSGEPPSSGDSPHVGADESGAPTVSLTLNQPALRSRVLAGPIDQLVPLSHPALPSAGGARLSVSSRGAALVVWNISDGLVGRLQAAFRPAGGNFGPSHTITPARNAPFLTLVDLAIADTGDAAMMYSLNGVPYVQAVAPSGHFGSRREIRGDVPSQIEFDPDGNLVGLFTSRRGALKAGVMRPNRRRFAHPDVLALAGSAFVVGRGSESRSRLVAAWARENGTYQVSVASPEGRFPPATSVFDPVPTPGCGGTTPPVVSSNARGDAIIAWCGVNGIMASVQPAGESFGAPHLVSRGDRPGSVTVPSVAMDPAGNAIAMWSTPGGKRAAWYTAPAR